MTAPVYPNARVLMNIGEGIKSGDDLNLMQALRESALWDMVAGASMANDDGGGAPGTYNNLGSSSVRVALWATGAAPIASATVRKLDTEDGVLLSYNSSVQFDGAGGFYSGGGVLAHHVRNNELAVTLAAGDPTNPRIDLVCVQLARVESDSLDNEGRTYKAAVGVAPIPATFVKRSKITAVSQVVQGTPAGSPTEPACPSGWSKLCAIAVPATWNAVIDPANITDYRYPLGWRRMTKVLAGGPDGGSLVTAGTWATNGVAMVPAGNPSKIILFPDVPNRHLARLRVITLIGNLDSPDTAELVRVNLEPTALINTVTVLQDLTSALGAGTDLPLDAFPTKPWWGNGFNAGIAPYRNPAAAPADARTSFLGLRINHTTGFTALKAILWGFNLFG